MPDGFEGFACDAGASHEMLFHVKACTDVVFGGTRLGRAGHFTFWLDDGLEHVVLETFNGAAIGCVSMDRDWTCATFQIVMSADRVTVFRILSEVVFRTLLIRRGRGLVLHAAGISCNGRGLALVGRSGTGKSTQARHWVATKGAVVLNEDRPAVTLGPDRATVHGTPWSGSSRNHRAASAPLAAVVLLEQGPANEARRIARTEALPRILPRVFMPYWSAAGMDDALAMVERLVTEVPIIHLRCLPDAGGVAELERALDV